MKTWRRRTIALIVAIAILLGGYVVYRFAATWQTRSVPRDFSEARTRGGLLAQEIVVNSNQIAADIAKLNEGDPTYAQASSTIGGILDKVTEIRRQAIQLAEELGTMTRALLDIRSVEARAAAMESISQQLTLVSSLISYTDDVTRLATALRLNLQSGADNDEEIARLIKRINGEVATINGLNQEANESMEEFDELVR